MILFDTSVIIDARDQNIDFFIGAHAAAEQMKLVTRDPARVATYYPHVELVLP